MMLVLYKWHL